MLKLTVVRKSKGMTQADLAKATGIAAPQINAIENRRIFPWDGWQARIAEALNWERNPSELFEEVEV